MVDICESAIDPTGRHGAVFERDDDTAFFYLLDLTRPDDNQIVEAFNAYPVTDMPTDAPVAVHWAASSEAVGLYVADRLVALFDLTGEGQLGRWATDEDRSFFARH